MNCFFNVWSIEVKNGLVFKKRTPIFPKQNKKQFQQLRICIEFSRDLRETKDVPQNRVGIKDTVHIECRVYTESSVENHFPNVTGRIIVRRVSRQWESSLWGISDILLHVIIVAASLCGVVELSHEGFALWTKKLHKTCKCVELRRKQKKRWVRDPTYLKAKTFSYLCTKGTAGITDCTSMWDNKAD